MTTRTHAPLWLSAAVVVGSLTLAGCAGSDPAEEQTNPPSSSAAEETTEATSSAPEPSNSASTEPTETSEPTESASPSPTATVADGVCTADMLDAVLETEMGGGAAGSVYRQLIFTNVSDEECEITGYPGVSYVDADGNQVGAPAERASGESQEVILAPGTSAIAPLQQTRAENYGAQCELTDTVGLRVYPPNDTASLIVDQTATACASTDIVLMTVSPTQPLAPQ
ncbi:hypothetical protein GCM10027403_37100 [Arthrobacter tecti]